MCFFRGGSNLHLLSHILPLPFFPPHISSSPGIQTLVTLEHQTHNTHKAAVKLCPSWHKVSNFQGQLSSVSPPCTPEADQFDAFCCLRPSILPTRCADSLFFYPAFLQLPDGWSRVQLREWDGGGGPERRGNGHNRTFVLKGSLKSSPLVSNDLSPLPAATEGEASDSQKDSGCEGWRRRVWWLHWRRRARFVWVHCSRKIEKMWSFQVHIFEK